MKIAFCTPGGVDHEDYAGGDLLGTEFQVFGLAQELIRNGHEVYILRRWYGDSKEENLNGIQIVNISSPDLPDIMMQKALTKILFSAYVAKKIKDIKPDIIIATEICSAYFLANIEIPKIYVTHNPPSDLVLDTPILIRYVKKMIEHRIFGACDVIVALNENIRKILDCQGYKTMLIPNAVDIEKYPMSQFDEKYILFGGRFVKIKGLHYLIDAYSQLKKELQMQYKLMLVGDGPEKESFEKMVIELGIENRVEFVPWQCDYEFIDIISKCSVFVLPSLFETFGIVIIEAMALGKPVIASDIPGPKNIIMHEFNGFLFENENVNELKKHLELCLSNVDLRKKLGENARKKVEENYTFGKIAIEYKYIFNSIIG